MTVIMGPLRLPGFAFRHGAAEDRVSENRTRALRHGRRLALQGSSVLVPTGDDDMHPEKATATVAGPRAAGRRGAQRGAPPLPDGSGDSSAV